MIIRNLLCCALLALTSLSHAATYTVSPTGQDSNPGTADAPWRTIQHAANTAMAGDTVTIGPGTYDERVIFARSGTPDARITFQGTRGADGSWETVLRGDTPAPAAWQPAPEIGAGVYKQAMGFVPMAMTANGLAVWRLGTHAWSGLATTWLTKAATAPHTTAVGTTPFWDGIEALFGVRDGVTYVRFRDQQHPDTMAVRVAPGGGTVTVNNRHYLTFQDLRIGGGQWGVWVTGGSTGTTLERCSLTHGQYAVYVQTAIGTTIKDSHLTLDGIGLVTHTPGDWTNEGPQARQTNRHLYDFGKFEVGNTQQDDARIALYNAPVGTVITGNMIERSMQGIYFAGTNTETTVSHNTIRYMADNCVYLDADRSTAQVHHNLIYDCDHAIRVESPDTMLEWDIYANRTWQPWYSAQTGSKHIFLSTRPSYPSRNRLRIYHNTMTGGGWAIDVGGGGGALPYVHVRNNLFSTRGLSSQGNVTWGTFANNLFSPMWVQTPMGDFTLPAGHTALDSAPSLLPLGWPGMTDAYYGDAKPDHGAVQASEGEEPPPAAVITVTMTAPAPGSTATGTIPVTARGTGPIAGVQFLLDGASLGGEQCCTSNQITWNTTTTPDGLHSLAARGRTAAGLTVTTPPVAVTVANVVAPTNRPPAPTAPAIITPYQTAGSSQVAPNDPDAGQTHTYGVTTIPLHGVATVAASGLLTYTPEPGYSGTDSFTVTVTDNGIPPLAGTLAVAVTVQAPIPTTVIVPWQCAGTLMLSDGVPTSSTLTCGKP